MKNVVITGTSRGIGLEIAKQCSQAGHRLLALSRNPNPVRELKLKNTNAIEFDLNNEKDYSKVSHFITNHWKRVDVLINNAGILLNKAFSKTTFRDFEAVYKTNVFGAAELTRIMLPFMYTDSHVVNISSIGGIQGSVKFSGLSAYSSSKAALIALTELLAEEFKNNGPSFNALALGAVQTEMLEEAFPGYRAPVLAKEMAAYILNFALSGNNFYNGKTLQISSSTP